MEENPNNSWKNLKNILLKTFNKHAPIISKRVKGKKSPWLTTSIKKEMNSRDLLHRKFRKSRCQTDYDTYRIQRNKVNVIVRKAKNKHYKSMLNESSNDPRRFWRTLKQIFPVNKTVTNAKSFFINGVLESKPARIASIFCKFFTNMAVKVKATSRLRMVYSGSDSPKNILNIPLQRSLSQRRLQTSKEAFEKQSNRLRRFASWSSKGLCAVHFQTINPRDKFFIDNLHHS